MRRSAVSDAIRRAALLPLSLAACGGPAALPDTTDGGHPMQSDGGDANPSDSGLPPACAVASTKPVTAYCNYLTYDLAPPVSACDPGDGGALPLATCRSLCPPDPRIPTLTGCDIDVSAGELTCTGVDTFAPCGTGRRPEGLIDAEAHDGAHAVAAFLAKVAWLEAASVPAFERLATELEVHGAPVRLCRAARRAAADEVRHARRIEAFARRAGAGVPKVVVEPRSPRSLEAMAIENAVEGCVRETFGAAVAAVQAARARDARFRAAMRRIARDEARHARLSWEVDDWLASKLDAASRDRVKRARDRAAAQILRETSVEPDAAVFGELGVPSAREARAMAGSLQDSLWAA